MSIKSQAANTKRKLLIGGALALPVFALGGAALAATGASATPAHAVTVVHSVTSPVSVTSPATPTSPTTADNADGPDTPRASGAADPADGPNDQSGVNDNATTGSDTAETPGVESKAGAEADGPGGHQDAQGANMDYQFNGQQ